MDSLVCKISDFGLSRDKNLDTATTAETALMTGERGLRSNLAQFSIKLRIHTHQCETTMLTLRSFTSRLADLGALASRLC